MWSEVFTHDYENGDKVAIILLDSQGIFDDQISMNECTMIFGLSTLISSVQCYNVMQSIQENHLQNLQLFTEYVRQATSENAQMKSFPELLFIVRDWPYVEEAAYGWNQEFIDNILHEKNDLSTEMIQLRRQIKSNYDSIHAFLLPYPGDMVAESGSFTGNLNEIDADFKNSLKELAPKLFAPNNLVIKKINGQKLRAGELINHLKAYMDMLEKVGVLRAPTAFNVSYIYMIFNNRRTFADFI